MPLDGSNLQDWQITLLKAAEIVRERWHQGSYGQDGGPRCGLGAIAEVVGIPEHNGRLDINHELRSRFSDIERRLSRMVNANFFAHWNDVRGRTAEEVASVMESVATQGRE